MGNIKFFWDNEWDKVDKDVSSYEVNWGGENTSKRWLVQSWRSKYGEDSGGGHFEIDSNNNKLYFYENSGTTLLTATISPGNYTAESLAGEIETQMESVGSNSYSVSYDYDLRKFKIVLDSGTDFKLLGSNNTNAIWDVIGKDGTDTGYITSWTADEIRIHTSEYLKVDLTEIKDISGVFVFNHNLQSGATIKVQFSTDDFTTISEEYGLSRGDNNKYVKLFDSVKQYRYVRIWIEDVDNPDGYVEIGRIWIGTELEPNPGYEMKRGRSWKDDSIIKISEGRQVASIQRIRYERWDYSFGKIKRSEWEDMIRDRGLSRELIIVEKKEGSSDYDEPENNSYYVRIQSFDIKHIAGEWWKGRMRVIEEN